MVSRASRFLYRLIDAHRPPLLQNRMIDGPTVTRWGNDAWVHLEDQKLVRRLFFTLLRDHCGQAFADYAFTMLNESLTAYATACPGQVKASYDFSSGRDHPSAVRTKDDLHGRPIADVVAEIEANAAAVRRACAGASPLTPTGRLVRKGVTS